jgi:hypothetical protein
MMTQKTHVIGAVAYDPKVVTIWEGMRAHCGNRVTRLLNAGFTQTQAQVLSGLHTSNFM